MNIHGRMTNRITTSRSSALSLRETVLPAAEAGKPWPEFRLRGGWKGTAELLRADFEEKIQVVHKKDLKNQADYARITTLYAGLVLRTRQPGDVYRPAGRSVHNRLRKWMNETGIPASQRDQLPLLAAGSEVLWVCGAGFAEGLAPDADTAQVLQMEMEHREEIT